MDVETIGADVRRSQLLADPGPFGEAPVSLQMPQVFPVDPVE
jgi:hypothetical protein